MTALKYRDAVLIPTVQLLVAQTGLTFQDDNARSHRARIVTDYIQQQGLQTILASKIAGSLTRIAAVGQIREENLRETPRYPHSSATGASIKSGVAGNSQRTVRNVTNSMRSRVNACIDRNECHTRYCVRYAVNNEISCKCRLYTLKRRPHQVLSLN